MTVRIRYFASLREALGPEESIELPPGGATLGQLRELLIARDAGHAQALARGRALRCALDQSLADEDRAVTDGSEVAFFPPVTGG